MSKQRLNPNDSNMEHYSPSPRLVAVEKQIASLSRLQKMAYWLNWKRGTRFAWLSPLSAQIADLTGNPDLYMDVAETLANPYAYREYLIVVVGE